MAPAAAWYSMREMKRNSEFGYSFRAARLTLRDLTALLSFHNFERTEVLIIVVVIVRIIVVGGTG